MSSSAPDFVVSLRRQLDSCIAMLGSCIDACSDALWDARPGGPPVWEQLYHTLFWLDAWLRDWSTPLEYPPFHVKEALDMQGELAAGTAISRPEMRQYFDKVVADCESYLSTLTSESVLEPREAFGKQWTPLDRTLGQIRHIQHHVGYLNAALRAGGCTPVPWVGFQE